MNIANRVSAIIYHQGNTILFSDCVIFDSRIVDYTLGRTNPIRTTFNTSNGGISRNTIVLGLIVALYSLPSELL